jgi:hypothetical protein
MNYEMLPEYMQDGMRLYIEKGIEPGSFLYSVLCNDLMGAFGTADSVNKARLADYCTFLYNEAPSQCHGSPAKVQAWIDGFKEAAA